MKYHAYCSMRHNCPLINTGKKEAIKPIE